MANTEQQVLDRLPSVEDVLSACNISFAPPKGNNEINIDCPFCDDTRRRFFFDTRIKRYYCHNCGATGGVLQFYSEIMGCDTKEAWRSFRGEAFNGERSPILHRKEEPPEKEFTKLAPIDIRDLVYRDLLNRLTLPKQEYENLTARGLSNKAISENGYKGMPNRKQADQICADLALKHKLEGVPGFYNKDGAWHMTTPAFYHLMVPVRDINGRIQGFQLRLGNEVKAVKTSLGKLIGYNVFIPKHDFFVSCNGVEIPFGSMCRPVYVNGKLQSYLVEVNGKKTPISVDDFSRWLKTVIAPCFDENDASSCIGYNISLYGEKKFFPSKRIVYPKYKWLSSAKMEGGVGPQNGVHFCFGERHKSSFIWTEGVLKPDVIRELTNMTVLGFIGTNSQAMAPEAIRQMLELGYTRAIIAYDSDMWTNPHVKKAHDKLYKTCIDSGLNVSSLVWDKKDKDGNILKGLDDYLCAWKAGKVLSNDTEEITRNIGKPW